MPNDKIPGGPKTIGVIMDGNRRWAKEQSLPTMEGHKVGLKKIKDLTKWAKDLGVSTIYLYAFSTENWNREKEEVNYLMKLFLQAFREDSKELVKQKVRVKFAGQTERFFPILRQSIKALERMTKNFSGLTLVFCLSYGGRAEIVAAIKKIAKQKTAQEIETLTEDDFSRFLWTNGLPNPELVIRTSGEVRTSNFLPWQTAYSEWFFSKTYWPAFTKEELKQILEDFSKREIRRGR
ncbi:MAG TPA: polyprenyl diphosphate synthase [Candidatus Portnoybacteria bacterium]|nr:polyprenyl diphosphate synthase [Candidatus Portnoybacteria bacterium]